MAVCGAIPGLRPGEMVAGRAHRRCRRRRRRPGVRRRGDLENPRPPAHLALRPPHRHPLDAGAHRATGPRAERLLLPPARPGRRRVRTVQRAAGRRPPGRRPPHPQAARCGAGARRRRPRRLPARLPADERRAARHRLQRRAQRQAAHLRPAGGAGAAGRAPHPRRGVGRADRALLHQPRAGDGEGLRVVVEPDRGRHQEGSGDGRVAAPARGRRRRGLLVRGVGALRQARHPDGAPAAGLRRVPVGTAPDQRVSPAGAHSGHRIPAARQSASTARTGRSTASDHAASIARRVRSSWFGIRWP